MDITSRPTALSCSECGDDIEETGYLPATESDGAYNPRVDAAICDTCGFNEVGMMGCAPELDDVVDPDPSDVLLYVQVTEDGVGVLSEKS